MGISSLGMGSSILTQDVIDQLKAADEASFVKPAELQIANENDKKTALSTLDATMTNFIDSVDELASPLLYDEREASVSGVSVEVVAAANTDIQDFTLDVVNLATKQIEQSDPYASSTELIASGAGSVNLNIDGLDFTIDYDATTTLTGLKDLINSVAGDKVDATIVQINSGEFRLFMSSVDTGVNQDITMTDNDNNLIGKSLTKDLTAIQTGVDANFTFNGQAVTRSSNTVSDLIVGLDITLKSVGSSDVSITQDRQGISDRLDSFVEKYNAAMTELNALTKPSVDSDERGIFSSDSSIKSMKSMIRNMVDSIGGGVGTLYDYGFDIDKEGVLSIDKTVFETKLDENPTNVEAFFSGGTFTNPDLTTTEVTGAFNEYSVAVESYTKYDGTLNQLKSFFTENISSLEEKKSLAVERLEAKYEIMAKQFAAYDLIINKFNTASSMFTQMANAQIAAQK